MSLSCWIIYNGFLPGNKFRDFAEMFEEAAISLGHQAILYKNNDLLALLDGQNTLLLGGEVPLPDYVIFTDKDIYLAKQLEYLNVPVFNSARSIAVSDDKISTYQHLSMQRLPIPRTIIAPKTFGLKDAFDKGFYDKIKEQFPYPFIIKETYGSFGEQVYLVTNDKELTETVRKIAGKPFMFQQFIKTSYGKDLRLQVVGDKVVAAMKRTSPNDFRANVTSGGKMHHYEPNEKEKTVAVQAAQAIGADFAGVDLLFGENDTPIICEVNSNAHIRNLLNCTGINTAYNIIHYIENKLKEVKR